VVKPYLYSPEVASSNMISSVLIISIGVQK